MKPTRRFFLAASLLLLVVVPISVVDARGVPRSLPAPTTISLALIFDKHIDPSQVLADEQAENIKYVWGAQAPEVTGGTAWHDYYVAWEQGWCPGIGLTASCPNDLPPSLGWLEKYHPDWILWQANSKGVPTKIAQDKGDPGPIVDFTNPAVQQYWMQNYIGPALRSGFNGVSFDNPTEDNSYGSVGHWNIAHTKFIKLYSGVQQDVKWVKAQAKALGQFLTLARTINPKAQFALNANLDCSYAPESTWNLAIKSVQTLADEEGYTYWGNNNQWITSQAVKYCKNRWLVKTQSLIAAEKAGKHVLTIDQSPLEITPNITVTNPVARTEIQWDLANYLIIKYSHTYLWFGHQQEYGNALADQPEFHVNFGNAVGDFFYTKGVYERRYTKGLAVVNPSPAKTFTVKLTAGKYQTVYGIATNKMTLGPHSGVVLDLKGSPAIP